MQTMTAGLAAAPLRSQPMVVGQHRSGRVRRCRHLVPSPPLVGCEVVPTRAGATLALTIGGTVRAPIRPGRRGTSPAR